MQQYLQVNTSNPPGNEIAAAKFFKAVFDEHGIQNEIFEYKPGRANIIARIKGNGSKRPIILASHSDVVTADPSAWEVDPFSGEMKGGYIYGRGAARYERRGFAPTDGDDPSEERSRRLSRDVIFLPGR